MGGREPRDLCVCLCVCAVVSLFFSINCANILYQVVFSRCQQTISWKGLIKVVCMCVCKCACVFMRCSEFWRNHLCVLVMHHAALSPQVSPCKVCERLPVIKLSVSRVLLANRFLDSRVNQMLLTNHQSRNSGSVNMQGEVDARMYWMNWWTSMCCSNRPLHLLKLKFCSKVLG